MKRTELLQETRKMGFEEAYDGCKSSSFTHMEAAFLLGYVIVHFGVTWSDTAKVGWKRLLDNRLTRASHRYSPVNEVVQLTEQYQSRYSSWNAKYFHTGYLQGWRCA